MRPSTRRLLLALGPTLACLPAASCGPKPASSEQSQSTALVEAASPLAITGGFTNLIAPKIRKRRPAMAAARGIVASEVWFAELTAKRLLFPVAGQTSSRGLKDTFTEARDANRIHHALDIPAKRGTPVLATENGRVIKLFTSAAGGLTIYTTDPTERYIYYYAHLDGYRTGLTQGLEIQRGDTLGYVGTTGNAPPNTPHLHFAILRSDNIKRWSKGLPINPYEVFRRSDLPAAK